MPTLSHENAIKEYYDQVKDKYPDIDFQRFSEICKAPFNFIKQCIKNDRLPIILVKYLGKFRVFPGKIKNLLRMNDRSLELGNIEPERHAEKKEYLLNYLAKLEDAEED